MALSSLPGIYSCWSCEGHHGPEEQDSVPGTATIWRLPRVFFFTDRQPLVHLLGRYLSDLFFAGRIAVRWRTAMVVTNKTFEQVYALEPDQRVPLIENQVRLSDLQKDAVAIGSGLREALLASADAYLERLDGQLGDTAITD